MEESVLQCFLLSAVPGQTSPEELRFSYQCSLARSLRLFLTQIEATCHISLESILEKTDLLNPKQQFSPLLFYCYTALKDAYEKKEMESLFIALQFIKNHALECFYTSERTYGSCMTESWELMTFTKVKGSVPLSEARMLPLVHWTPSSFPPAPFLAAEKLMETEKEMMREYEVYVSSLKFFSGRVLEGVTSPLFFGNIYLRLAYPHENATLFYLEHLIHELSHLHLFAMMGLDPLILNPEEELFTSPIRSDKRPMSGIFHAAFVLARIARAFGKLPQTEEVVAIYNKTKCSLEDALNTISAKASLTPAGRSVFESLSPCARL